MAKKIHSLVALGLLTIANAAAAAPAPFQNPAQKLFIQLPSNDPKFLLVRAIGILLSLVGLISIAYIIWGGWQYIMSGANPTMAESGKKTIRNAITGLIIVILSYIIVTVVVNSLTNAIE